MNPRLKLLIINLLAVEGIKRIEQDAARYRKWDFLNPEKRRLAMDRYSKTEKARARFRAYYRRHREERLKKQLEKRLENPDHKRAIWRKSNRKTNATRVKKRWQRYLTDPAFNVNIKVRRSIWSALNKCKKGLRKTDKTIDILGCSFDELKVHIENQFRPGMTWDMVLSGEIQLDHIRPVAKFNLLDPEEVKRCFHFSNLQPLFKLDNLSKRDKVAEEYGNLT